MLNHSSGRLRAAVLTAADEARRLRHDYVGPEHLLLGLVKGQNVASLLFKRLRIDARALGEEAERLVRPVTDPVDLTEPVLNPRSRRIFDFAAEEAALLRNTYLGTEHLLLGLFREEEGLAGMLLRERGLTLEGLRDTIFKLQRGEPDPPSEGAAPVGSPP